MENSPSYVCTTTAEVLLNAVKIRDTGGRLHICAGDYHFLEPLEFDFSTTSDAELPKGIALTGDGPGVTRLIWRGEGTDGVIIRGNATTPYSLRSLSLLKEAGPGGTAFRIQNNVANPWGYNGSLHTLHDFVAGGLKLNGPNHWDQGLALHDARDVKVSDFLIYGSEDHLLNPGIATLGSTTNISFSGGDIVKFKTGMRVGDVTEGIALSRLNLVGGELGILIETTGCGHVIDGCHFDVSNMAVKALGNRNLNSFHPLRIAMMGNLVYSTVCGFNLRDVESVRIIGNTFHAQNTNRANAAVILAGRGYDCTIQGNHVIHHDPGILFEEISPYTPNHNVIVGNRFTECSPPFIGSRMQNTFGLNNPTLELSPPKVFEKEVVVPATVDNNIEIDFSFDERVDMVTLKSVTNHLHDLISWRVEPNDQQGVKWKLKAERKQSTTHWAPGFCLVGAQLK